MASAAPLRCWWGDVHIADLEPKRRWDLRCRYTDAALDRWAIGTPLLSCSLPLGTRPMDANRFLRGVLPEGAHLQAVASLARVPTNDTYGLLARFGRDVAGAIVITTADGDPDDRSSRVERYSEHDLRDEVSGLGENPLGLHADSELSIAGIQNKLLLVTLGDGRWGRPVHGYPSTHILKVDDDRYPGLVRAEASCLDLAHAIGLAYDRSRIETFDGRDGIIVARYDRRTIDGRVVRMHQEDACQALGIDIDANRGRGKYEAHGGPTLVRIADLLRTYARDPGAELDGLLRLITYTAAIGNADLHGKNVSLVHDDEGRVSLAPAYDTVPTMRWPRLRSTSAVSVGGTTDFADIDIERIADEADRWGVDRERARAVSADTLDAIERAIPETIDDAELAAAIAERTQRMLP